MGLTFSGISSSFAADFYVTPTGNGDQSGHAWIHARPATELQLTLDTLKPGDTLHLGSGIYHLSKPLVISNHGTSEAVITLAGVDTGNGLPLLRGGDSRDESENAYSTGLHFPGAASHWIFKDLRLAHFRIGVQMPPPESPSDLRSHLRFENIDGEYMGVCFQFQNVADVVVRDCDAIRYTGTGFRFDDQIHRLSFRTCTADATGGDNTFATSAATFGFRGGVPEGKTRINHLIFTDCTARNNRAQRQGDEQVGGDGFSTGAGTDRAMYLHCRSFNNDADGFDDAADNTTYVDCVTIGNRIGFCYRGDGAVYQNCLAAYNGESTPNCGGLRVHGRSGHTERNGVRVFNSTFHHNGPIAFETVAGGRIAANGCILTATNVPPAANPTAGHAIKLINTTVYLEDHDDHSPGFFAPSPTWRGKPANAFDSGRYQGSKGYHSGHVGSY